MSLRFVAISDTHGQHKDLTLPQGDVLLHAGDISSGGRKNEIVDFIKWFEATDYKYKVFIAGNHDFYFEEETKEEIESLIPSDIIYLNDSITIIDGIKIWGSPITPWFYDWAFNRHRGNAIKKHWDIIPADTDILITHGPSFGILDTTQDGKNVGCEELMNAINIIQPKIHLCGHIHEAYGKRQHNQTTFINASVLNINYRLVNKPIVFDL
ncbi:MAG: metallophosphoesterase [Sphingobacteriales bacterium]|nr:MAG: metallophosphoesterase [Sphingobacteriales bacterium]